MVSLFSRAERREQRASQNAWYAPRAMFHGAPTSFCSALYPRLVRVCNEIVLPSEHIGIGGRADEQGLHLE